MSHSRDEKHSKLVSGYCMEQSGDMNIVDGIIAIICQYLKSAKWSRKYEGDNIKLNDDDSKAINCGNDGESVRASFEINKSNIISWEVECMIIYGGCNFVGVVTSNVDEFNGNPGYGMQHAYGIDDDDYSYYYGDGDETFLNWEKPIFPANELYTVKVIADWTEKRCKLTYFYKDEKLNKNIDDFTLLLPEFDDDIVLYPCVTPFNAGAYCIIRYA